MKILWHSNAPWAPTGYGSQVNLFAEALNEHHDLSLSAFYGLEGSRLAWNGIQIYPGVGGEYGNLSLVPHAKHAFGNPRGGLVFTLLDVWVLDHAICQQLNMASWVPVDHDPCPPRVTEFFRQSAAVPVAMSRFGQERLAEFDPLYIPHGVDTDTFKPIDQVTAREATKLDKDAFVVGVVAANKGRPSRKSFQQSLEAFRFFRERHEDAVLYLHTMLDGNFSSGEDLDALIQSLEIPTDSLRVANQYRLAFNPLPSEGMARLYSSFDVLLNPSQGEGFGIPIIEAQACGTPAIVTDHSAMPEVCGAGWHVPGRPHWTGQKSWQAIPDVAAIVGALEERYAMTDEEREAQNAAARAHALDYSREVVLRDHFLPALDELAERFGEVPRGGRGLMFIQLADQEFEVLGCDDYPFLKQLQREISHTYEFDSIPFEKGDTVVDIGAHVGLVSIFLAVKYGVRCYAYEPVPENFASLVKNIGANQAEVIPFNQAVTANGRDLTIFHGTHSGEHGAFIHNPMNGSVDVSSTTLRHIFRDNNIKRCRLLKLDCEGAEHEIVAKMSKDLRKRIDHVRGEIHLNKPLRNMGYTVEGTRDSIPGSEWMVCDVT